MKNIGSAFSGLIFIVVIIKAILYLDSRFIELKTIGEFMSIPLKFAICFCPLFSKYLLTSRVHKMATTNNESAPLDIPLITVIPSNTDKVTALSSKPSNEYPDVTLIQPAVVDYNPDKC